MVVSGTVVLPRIPVTTRSTVSAAWTVQSPSRAGAGAMRAGDRAIVRHYPRRPVRSALALLAATATAALGALLLGAYDFSASTSSVAGVLFGGVLACAPGV